jgi:hypothetical protein
MAPNAVFVDAAMNDDERRRRLFAGDIFVYAPTPASLALVDFAQRLLRDAFGGRDPRTVHRAMTREAVAAVLLELKPRFIHHPRCKQLLPQLLTELGCDADETYFDVPRMRSSYPSDFLTTGIAYAFPAHRDTWFSAPHCQINWWMPMYEITPENAMGLYPHYFDAAVPNNSEVYNYYKWNAMRGDAAKQIGSRQMVEPLAALTMPAVKFLPPPGALLVFSAAQLHETMPNTSGVCRYSIDFRTVHRLDAFARRGAANIDSRSTGSAIRDFLRASDPTQRLPDEVIERYNDGTEGEGVLIHEGAAEPQPATTKT